jgi:hypothetical protein
MNILGFKAWFIVVKPMQSIIPLQSIETKAIGYVDLEVLRSCEVLHGVSSGCLEVRQAHTNRGLL